MSALPTPDETGDTPAGDPPAGDAASDDAPGVDRLLALSDGVVAIALTLLVLELKVPSTALLSRSASAGALATRLGKDGDLWIAYLISFYVIAQFWLVHHRTFRRIRGQREGLAWWNLAFLFTVTVLPFTSDLLGNYPDNPLAVDIFAVNLLAASLATWATSSFSRRRGLLVTRPGGVGGQDRTGTRAGHDSRHRLVDRPGLGEHVGGQIQLAAVRRHAAGRRGRDPAAAPPAPGRGHSMT